MGIKIVTPVDVVNIFSQKKTPSY